MDKVQGVLTVTDRMGIVITRQQILSPTRRGGMAVRNEMLRVARAHHPDAMYFTDWREGSR
jgi:hypothetical protein